LGFAFGDGRGGNGFGDRRGSGRQGSGFGQGADVIVIMLVMRGVFVGVFAGGHFTE
jgi:hypothetical protein